MSSFVISNIVEDNFITNRKRKKRKRIRKGDRKGLRLPRVFVKESGEAARK